MGAFSKYNPCRVAVMVVDRVPLVCQQAKAINEDTGLRVLRLCAETRTTKRIDDMINGYYDAVVVTAGSLLNLLDESIFQLDSFSNNSV